MANWQDIRALEERIFALMLYYTLYAEIPQKSEFGSVEFVREDKKDAFGNTAPFYCFGFVDYVSSTGDFPMSITWKTQRSILPQFLKAV